MTTTVTKSSVKVAKAIGDGPSTSMLFVIERPPNATATWSATHEHHLAAIDRWVIQASNMGLQVHHHSSWRSNALHVRRPLNVDDIDSEVHGAHIKALRLLLDRASELGLIVRSGNEHAKETIETK